MTAATVEDYTADLTGLGSTSSTIASLAGQSSSTLSDLMKLVVDVASFAQIGLSVGAVNNSLQSMLSQALGEVSTVLSDVGQQVAESGRGYAAADQTVAASFGAGAGGPSLATGAGGSTGVAASPTGADGDAFIDHFASNHHQGATGSEVKEFQRELVQLGYRPGTADGQWGPATENAYQAYLAQHHYVAGSTTGGTSIDLPGELGVVTAPNQQAATAVRAALSQTGVPYLWGGKTPAGGLDCSGLTRWAYGQAGVRIPDGSGNQAVGTAVPQAQLQPGDLAVWQGHVAMYIGENKMVEAPQTGEHVHITPLRTHNGRDAFLGFYRPSVPAR